MSKEQSPDLYTAYALQTPEDSVRLYGEWAARYDQDFAQGKDYILPRMVALAFAEAGGRGPVLDIGAGTGLLAEALVPSGVGPIDGTDISQEMLDIADAKALYRRVFTADVTQSLPVEEGHYVSVVSSGTFTHGHVGPEALGELLRVTAPGGLIALSINAAHFEARGFDAELSRLAPQIRDLRLSNVPIYGPDCQEDHKDDQALIALFHKV